MSNPRLIDLLGAGGASDDRVRLQYDESTGELYVNDKKVITEMQFKPAEVILAWVVAISVAIQALMAVLTYFCK